MAPFLAPIGEMGHVFPYLLPAAGCGSGARCPEWLPGAAPNSLSFACPPRSQGRSPGPARSPQTCRACRNATYQEGQARPCFPADALCLSRLRHGPWLPRAGPTRSLQIPTTSPPHAHHALCTHTPPACTGACARIRHTHTCARTRHGYEAARGSRISLSSPDAPSPAISGHPPPPHL